MDDDRQKADSSLSSARDVAQHLLNKNIELENGLRKAAKSKIPSDPNTWLQMRENYEVILLSDHDFSEKHEVGHALWQLHYRRIEEFRSHISAAAASAQGGKNAVRPERISKIRSIFKGFLSEATGFYHDLILKIRSKYGLPMSYMPESPEIQFCLEKDVRKSEDMKNGMLSCHRCFIYLGDLSRYKGLYGDGGDNAARDYSAASSYYLQAASFCPSSGNPHHQLAILASYSGDEFTAIYRYFRSLAVESPFLTARDNLVIAFEKNRQVCSQLPGDSKISAAKKTPVRASGRGRGRGETKLIAKETNNAEAFLSKEDIYSVKETFKAFCIRFVRLNGILFTRTSLETFGDIFARVISDLCKFLSSGLDEDVTLGSDIVDKRLFFVRMISVLVYSVHNANRESEGQTYAEILQRSVLVQNAFTGAFEIVGHIVKRCVQFQDLSLSHLLPAILIFIEWLASCPDIAAGSDVMDNKQASARSFFWTQCIALFNKLVSSGYAPVEKDDDETCFVNMGKYDEGETVSVVALWEDFELRGFLPLQAAHLILDFSRKYSSDKEKKARVQRMLAAGRTLVSAIRIGQQGVYYDRKLNQFCLGIEPEPCNDDSQSINLPDVIVALQQETLPFDDDKSFANVIEHTKELLDEDEEEVILFKPAVSERPADVRAPSTSTVYEPANESRLDNSNSINWTAYSTAPISTPLANVHRQATPAVSNLNIQTSTPYSSAVPQAFTHVTSNGPSWMPDQRLTDDMKYFNIAGNGNLNTQTSAPYSIAAPEAVAHVTSNGPNWMPLQRLTNDDMKNFNIAGNGHATSGLAMLHGRMSPVPSLPFSKPIIGENASMSSATLSAIPEGLGSFNQGPGLFYGANADNSFMGSNLGSNEAASLQKRNSVTRPIGRHVGPPPGFGPMHRQINDPRNNFMFSKEQMPVSDDYRRLDGYQARPIAGSKFNAGETQSFVPSIGTLSDGVMNFPFRGNQIPDSQFTSVDNNTIRMDTAFESRKLLNEQQRQLQFGVQQPNAASNQYEGNSLWSNQFLV